MAGLVAPVADEREALLAFLRQMRYVLRLTAYGLTDEQARTAATSSPLTVGGLVKHVTSTEQGWVDTILGLERPPSAETYVDDFHMGPDETLPDLLAAYERAAARTEEVIAGVDDLGQAVPVPRGVPWFPADVDAWSVRWVLLHLVQETARHAGHADIVREAVDGGTAFPIMAAAEGWPESPWMQPWKPAAVAAAV
jgi:hypothetical protein